MRLKLMKRAARIPTLICFIASALRLYGIDEDALADAAKRARALEAIMKLEELEGPQVWESRLSAGVTFKSGNTDSENFVGGIETAKLFGKTLFRASAEGAYETTQTHDEEGNRFSDQTAGSARVIVNVKQRFEDFFLFADLTAYHDDMSDLRYRVIESGGIGKFLIEAKDLVFSIETGFAYIHERTAERDDYLGLRFAERLDWKVSDTFMLWEKGEMISEFNHFGNRLVSGEVGAESAINGSLSLAVKYKIEYDSDPSKSVEHLDSLFLAQLTFKF